MSAVYIVVIVVLAVLVVLLGLAAFVGLLHLTRGTPVSTVRDLDGPGDPPALEDEDFERTLQIHVNTRLVEGNRVEVLLNGEEVYPRLFEDLAAARELVTWTVFWFKPGALAERLRDALAERARAGVRVLFMYDMFGAWGIPSDYFDALRQAGVEVAEFRPVRWNTLHKAQQRSHIRSVVIDGRIGYTGGFAIDDHWQGDGRGPGWRDTSVRLEGAAVEQLQSAFAADWAEATGELLIGQRIFPQATHAPDGAVAGLMYSAPTLGSTDAERFFALSIVGARRYLYITNAYFIPDDDFRGFLCDAVARGVDVRVLTPGANSDRLSTWYASRVHYEQILAAGVRIWEYSPTMVHAKTLVADDIWSEVGSVNFDNRSMALNDEVALMVRDGAVAERLRTAFLADLDYAEEVDLDAFRRRGAWQKLKELFFIIFVRLL